MVTKDIAEIIESTILQSCRAYFQEAHPDKTFPEDIKPTIQVSRDKAFGDLSSTIALKLASFARTSPVDVAEGICKHLEVLVKRSKRISVIDDIRPVKGFINFRLSSAFYAGQLKDIFSKKDNFGKNRIGEGLKVNVEFVSANPTGPLTIAHGRQAALGDAIARIMRFSGYEVTCEYYLNDVGRQIRLLGESVRVRYFELFGKKVEMPEDGYQGDYVGRIADSMKRSFGDTLLDREKKDEFCDFAVSYMLSHIKKDLDDFGVEFNHWSPQSAIESRGEVEKTLVELEKKGFIYEKDGAKWFSSTNFGDDKDRVVVKSDSTYTYLAPDIAYHRDKYSRGYEMVIDLLGPDHHGYIKRMEAAVEALGCDAATLNILIVQLVTLLRSGEKVSMSTRKGEFIALRQIMDEVGTDVTRYYFLSRRLDTHLDFDIDLAKKESKDNPVYYIQYAHARICSIKKFSKKNRIKRLFAKTDLGKLVSDEEKALIRHLSEFPVAVVGSLEALEPNRMVSYLNDLARFFHSFYTECRVVTDDHCMSNARLYLVECARIVLSNGLRLLNISLPEKM